MSPARPQPCRPGGAVFIGVDIGSQSLKAVALDEKLRLLGSGRRAYPISFPAPGWAEQDPALWEAALAPAIAEALAQAGRRADEVAALGLAGQLDGCLPVAADGRALGPCLIWMDRRADAKLGRVAERLAPDAFRARTGANLDGGHMAPKMRWLLDELPAARRAARFHQPVSYMVQRLTGVAALDHGIASTSLIYDLAKGAWAEDLAAAFDLDLRLLPPLRRAEEMAGRLSAAGAALSGLRANLPVAVGTGDDFSTPLGAGVMGQGLLVNVLGTAEVVGALHDRAAIDPSRLTETHRYVGGRLFYIENPGWVSGGALEWLRGLLGFADFAGFDRAAALVPPASDDLLFLPALGGAMTPEWNAAARGAFYGLTPAHGAGHLARAALEGNVFGMIDVLEALGQMGVAARRIRLLGGGAKSALWAQMRADASGLPVERAAVADSSAVGAAMLGAVAAGFYPDLESAAGEMPPAVLVAEPDVARHEIYRAAHARYRRLYHSLKPMFQS